MEGMILVKLNAEVTTAIARAVFHRMVYLQSQPKSEKRDAEKDALTQFSRQMEQKIRALTIAQQN